MKQLPVKLLNAFVASIVMVMTSLQADTLSMPGLQKSPENGKAVYEYPVRGINMEDVSLKFGAPDKTRGPVGNPPITRWTYKNFTVVFENDIVIHTVSKSPTH